MSDEIAAIDIQMNEFAMALKQIDNTCNILNSLADDIINDYKNAKTSLSDAINCAKESNLNVNESEMNKFNQNMLDSYSTELRKIDDTFKNLDVIMNDAKEFEQAEINIRRELMSNMDEFNESNLKKLINTKTKISSPQDNPKYVKLVNTIQSLNEDNQTEDLVIDTVQNQIIKCPITGKPIQNAFKNKCGHSYEKEAILNYCRSRNVKRCPYAGCESTISINDIYSSR